MKVAIISEPPPLTTGFGRTCGQLVKALASRGHEVVCFGMGLTGEVFDRDLYPCRIWATGKASSSKLAIPFEVFLQFEQPNVIIVNFDLATAKKWVERCLAINPKIPIISHLVIDGLPVPSEQIDFLRLLSGIIVPTITTRDFLINNDIKNAIYAPHGIEASVFKALENREALRKRACIGDKFVVGLFGRNTERKQHVRLMQAIAILTKMGLDDILLYLHCDPHDTGLTSWDLKFVSESLGIDNVTLFPSLGFDQLLGIPYEPESETRSSTLASKRAFTESYSYVERVNCCDVIVNCSFCGGFELGIIEAQACGVPLIATDDYGVIREVVGGGGYLLEAVDVGIWKTGAKQYFLPPSSIAEALLKVKKDAMLRSELIGRGLENIKKYSWVHLHEAINDLVEHSI